MKLTPLRTGCLITFKKCRSSRPPELFYKKAVLKNFTIFTWKCLWWRLFLIPNIVEPLHSGQLRVLKNLSVIKRCPLLRGSLTNIVTFGAKYFVRYSRHVRCWEVSLHCQIFKSTYFKEHLRTVASENMLMKQKN